MEFLQYKLWGATSGDYIAFLLIVVVTFLFKKFFSRLLARLTAGMATRVSEGKYRKLFRALIRKPLEWLIAIFLLFIAFNFIDRPLSRIIIMSWKHKNGLDMLSLADICGYLFSFFGILFTLLFFSRLIDFFFRAKAERAIHHLEKERAQLLPLMKDVLKILLWTIGLFWILGAVFRVNIPALITGLGIGGVALALAAKESIENLIASFTILADKPFVADDTVRLGTLEGKVVRIGFRSTRLRNSDGTLLIVPNKKLIDESLENLSERDIRKIKLLLPIHPLKQSNSLETLMNKIREAVDTVDLVQAGTNVSIDSFMETYTQILVVYHLPDNFPESKIQGAKDQVNLLVYELIYAAMDGDC